jgi:hypothetical protein
MRGFLQGGIMKKELWLAAILAAVIFSGCHTSASFMLPPNTDLVINGERVTFDSKDEDGHPRMERSPFFWTSIIGIEYYLLEGDKVIKKDRLPSEFRIASIFWPPYAYIYWPVGFHFDCYDLTNPTKEFVEKCPTREELAKKNSQPAAKPAQ